MGGQSKMPRACVQYSLEKSLEICRDFVAPQKKSSKIIQFRIIDCLSVVMIDLGVFDASRDLFFYALLLRLGIKLKIVKDLYNKKQKNGKVDFSAKYLISTGVNHGDITGTAMFLRVKGGNVFYLFK